MNPPNLPNPNDRIKAIEMMKDLELIQGWLSTAQDDFIRASHNIGAVANKLEGMIQALMDGGVKA